MTQPATASDEIPAFFPAGEDMLLGILTEPTGVPLGVGFIILAGGATPLTTNRNRLSVKLCRQVASMGYHAFRFDYHGAGESTGAVPLMRMDRPHIDDLLAAIRWLRGRGVDRFVLAGSCIGSRTALAAAPEVEGLDAVILVSLPLQDHQIGDRSARTAAEEWSLGAYVRRAFRPATLKGLFRARKRRLYLAFVRARWVRARTHPRGHRRSHDRDGYASPSVLRPLGNLVERGVPVMLLYGERDGYFMEFQRDREAGRLDLLDRAGSSVELHTLAGQVHGFTSLGVQDAVIDAVRGWLDPSRRDDHRDAAATDHR